MDQVDLEIQLKVWKEIAISKQILMRAACEALGIDPDASADVLKVALDAAIKKSIEAEANISEAQEHAKTAIGVMDKKIFDSERVRTAAEAARVEALAAQQKAEQAMAAMREAQERELKAIKAQLVEKDKTMKAINKALADTPENVLKKLKTLKKQKDDEAEERKLIANEAANLRKEKRVQEQRVITLKAVVEQSGKLATQHRELHAQCVAMHDQLVPLVESADLTAVPALDEHLLEGIETAVKNEEK